MKNNTIAIAIASLLVGGVATAAYVNNDVPGQGAVDVMPAEFAPSGSAFALSDRPIDDSQIPIGGRLEYAQVLAVAPVTRQEPLYGKVIGTEPVRETSSVSSPQQVCENVAVQERLPERDGNVGGTVAGALIGGLVGNQVGGGNGRKAATVAGAAAGGYVGNRVDRRYERGQVVTRNDRQCRTVSQTSTRSRTVAWNVTYRTPDGITETIRTDRKPGSRISLGSEKSVIGYDVTYRYRGAEHQLRMDDKPGARLPVIDGHVVTEVAAADSRSRG